jgi:lysophospholipase L1-like esterase
VSPLSLFGLTFRLFLFVMAAGVTMAAPPQEGFLKEGDVWVFHGDSITHADTYRRMCERVFRHYHPDVKVEFIQAGVWGSPSSEVVKQMKTQGRQPTVVSLMTGMNNAINSDWVKGMPREKHLAAYRKDLTEFVQNNKAAGAAVLLMSPTLTDETSRRSFFRIAGCTDFISDCRKVVQEVAQAEGAFYVPVQEEFEAFQAAAGPKQRLRSDGVHPASLGEYAIARSLWEHLDFAAPLATGDRRLNASPAASGIALKPVSGLVEASSKGLDFTIETPNQAPGTATVTWSLGDARKTEEVPLNGGRTPWTLALPPGFPALKNGEATEAIIDVRIGKASALFVADLCAVPVLHFADNVVSGTVESTLDRPEGRLVAKWQLTRQGGELLLDVEVTDSQIQSSSEWAFARDGLSLFLDLRPTDRIGGINLDDDVHQVFVNFYEQPFVAAAVRPWAGAGLENVIACKGEKTAAGYRLRLRFGDRLNLREPFALDQREFLGLALAIADVDKAPKGNPTSVLHDSYPVTRPRDQYANGLALVDLKDKWLGSSAMNLHLFP